MTVEGPVVRMWRGVVRSKDRQAYVEYIERTGMREYRETPGNEEAWMLSREEEVAFADFAIGELLSQGLVRDF